MKLYIAKAYHNREKALDIGMWTIACLGGFLFIYLGAMFLKLSQQFLVAWTLTAMLIVFKRIKVFERPPLRIIFLLITAFITLRYWFWRTFETLIYTGPFDFIGMMALYLAEVYGLLMHFLGMFTNVWPLRRKIAPLPADRSLYPTVDVFIPTYNEPEEIVRVTVTAATLIDYPKEKLHVYILDDGGTVAKRNRPDTGLTAWERYYSFKRMAREVGVEYITRETNSHAKAGNLNHALRHTNGDLILVLDCDHVPTRDILRNTAGWFLRDKSLFLVQTPHFFINPDPLEKNLQIFGDAPSENDMFYHSIHLGLDFWNASYFCGSAAILRRKYLEEGGGIAGETITEDAETTVGLHNKGYNSVYIERPMICGLSPESIDDMVVQRSRWAQGMVQIFMLKNPMLQKGMKLYQRLSYITSTLFWFFGFPRFIFYIIPAAFLLFGLRIYHASFIQVLAYTLPHIIGSFIISDFLHGKHRWPFFSELFESVQSIFLLRPVVSAIHKPKHPTFKVTPKGTSLEKVFLSPMITPFFIMVFIIISCVPMAIIRWLNYPLYRDVIIITFSWSIFNLFIAMASLGAFLERQQVRRQHRVWAKGKVNVFFTRLNQIVQGEIKDISFSGMGIELNPPFQIKPEDNVTLEVRDIFGERYKFEARISRVGKKKVGVFCGCQFVPGKNPYSQLVKYIYGDSQRWQDFCEKKSKPISPLKIMLFMVRMGAKGSKDCFVILFQMAFFAIKKAIHPLFMNIKKLSWKRAKEAGQII